MKSISVVAIPEYLLTTMKSVGISLADINVFGVNGINNNVEYGSLKADGSNNYTYTDSNYARGNLSGDDLGLFFKNKLSNNDIHDLVSGNEIFYTYVLNARTYMSNNHLANEIPYMQYCNYFNDKSSYNNNVVELLQHLSKGRFTISEDNFKDTFTIVIENDTLFLILKEGFGNLVSCNRSDLKDLILDLIIEQSFDSFGEQITINSGMFSCYLGKLLNKN